MSQHDFTIDNQTFPATRSDINSALQALASLSSGASSPSTTFAYQLWVDTTSDPNILNVRNSANNAWIKIGEINQGSAAFILTAYAILQAGSAAAPSHSFDTDRDTGMYRAAANIIGFATNGTERVRINDSGQAEFSSGTAALPSITTIGDTNTGVFYPAADTVAISTSGVERMRINSSGNVGIGTASPSSPLNVVAASTSLAIAINGRSSDNLGAMYLYANDGTTQQATITASASEFRFSSVPAAAVQTFYTNAAERMRIASAGQIGIGGANYGTSGQVLTSGGASAAPSWATPTTPAWVLISTQTASASSSIDFTGLSGYSRLRLSAQNITVSSTATDHGLRLSSDNGATFISTSSYNNKGAYPTSTTATGYVSSTDSFFALHPIGNGTYTGLAYEMLIENFNIAQRTILYGPSSKQSTGATERIMFSMQTGTTAMNAIRILQSSGTITTGTFTLEGIVG